jgi:hypothetical protein
MNILYQKSFSSCRPHGTMMHALMLLAFLAPIHSLLIALQIMNQQIMTCCCTNSCRSGWWEHSTNFGINSRIVLAAAKTAEKWHHQPSESSNQFQFGGSWNKIWLSQHHDDSLWQATPSYITKTSKETCIEGLFFVPSWCTAYRHDRRTARHANIKHHCDLTFRESSES